MSENTSIQPSAIIDPDASIGAHTKVWHFAHICSEARIGERCSIGQNVFIAPRVQIGNNVKIQNNVSVYEGVTLEDDVFCGPSMVFTNVKTPRSSFPRNTRKDFLTTRVARGASLGANCTVVCGVTIGEWALVAAAAVVTKDVPPRALMAGVPARQIGWACECGVSLKLAQQAATCTPCGRQYVLTGSGRLQKIEATSTLQPSIPILDLKPEIDALMPQLIPAMERVIRSGHFILGQEVSQFEGEAASYLGVKHAVGLNSGTDALVIALRALGIGPGDEVITTAFTFFATAEAISIVGATPIFVDIDADTFNIDPDSIRISKRTKAIMPVHLFGQSAQMGAILEIARHHGIAVIEDVAQAFGGRWQNNKLGTLGDMGCFSFFPSKNLGAYGDAGMVVTNNDRLAEAARKLRTHGSLRKYYNETLGYNSRLDELQAAILRVKLPHIDHWNHQRKEAAHYYSTQLTAIGHLRCPQGHCDHVYHQYTVRVLSAKRDAVYKHLKDRQISTMIYYPVPVHRLPIYANRSLNYPVAEKAAEQVLSLPLWPGIERSIQDRVVVAIAEALKESNEHPSEGSHKERREHERPISTVF